MERLLKIYVVMGFILTLGTGYAQMEMGLDNYLQIAVINNPGMKAKYTRFEMAMERIAQSNGLPDPTLSFGYFIQPIETKLGPQQAKVSLTQMFPWFGSLKANSKRDTLIAQVYFEEFMESKNKLNLEVKETYYSIYELRKIIKIHQENIDILENFKHVSTAKYKNGLGSMVDVIRVDILLEYAQTEIQVLKSKNYPLQVGFNRLLNRADSMEVLISNDLNPLGYGEFSADSLMNENPVLRGIELQMEVSKARETVARKQGNPMIGVGVDYVFVGNVTGVENSGNDAFMPMVTMTLPIYRKKYKSAIRETQLEQSAWQSEHLNYENILRADFEMVNFNWQSSVQKLTMYERQIKSTEMAIKILVVSYSNSGKDFEEVLRMQQKLLDYQKAQIMALKENYMTYARMQYLMGSRIY